MRHRRTGIGRIATINSDGHVVGLDLGATSVRVAVLAPSREHGRPSVTLQRLGSLALPPGTIVNGEVCDAAVLTSTLKRLWDIHDFACDHVILGVATPHVLVRDMEIPNLTPAQQAKALPFQARDVVALPIEQVILDFVPLGEADAESNRVKGLLIATPRQPVVTAVRAVERAGLKVARVDLSSFAMLRSIADEHHAVEAVIDLGADLTTIVIHHQGVPKLVRTLARGGKELTARLVEKMDLTEEVAERAKCEVGALGPHGEVARILNEGLRPLLAEIRSSISYFDSASKARLERISLTGGASGLAGLASLMSDQIGVPTNVITPMQHLRNRWAPTDELGDDERSASAVAVGLAMGAAA